jgi:L-alanine-DL-glutamate epimerase-like enolase superfamily enzyme
MSSAAARAEIAHVHHHSLRVRSGAEVLVARVTATQRVVGYGFAFNLQPWVARDMAAWDAAAREAGRPLWKLLGGAERGPIRISRGSEGIDPWRAGSAQSVRALAPDTLLAPNSHPWEIAWCATLVASLRRDAIILVPDEPSQGTVTVPDEPGIGVDWSLEPGFASLAWQNPGF